MCGQLALLPTVLICSQWVGNAWCFDVLYSKSVCFPHLLPHRTSEVTTKYVALAA